MTHVDSRVKSEIAFEYIKSNGAGVRHYKHCISSAVQAAAIRSSSACWRAPGVWKYLCLQPGKDALVGPIRGLVERQVRRRTAVRSVELQRCAS